MFLYSARLITPARSMSYFMRLCLIALIVSLSACAYTWRGEQGSIATDTILGDGSKTITILSIEQPTLYPWLSYFLRSELRDEITQRGLARWVDSGKADYELTVVIKDFTARAYGSYSASSLVTASTNMELTVYDGTTNELIWQSGLISYAETYESINEDVAIKELLGLLVQRAIDRLQQRF